MQRHLRYGAYLAGAGLVAASVTPILSSGSATAADTATPSSIAAAWLSGQLADGLVRRADGTVDYSASVDAGLALAAVGSTDAAKRVSAAIASAGTTYTEFDYVASDGNRYTGTSADAVAKLLALELDTATPTGTCTAAGDPSISPTSSPAPSTTAPTGDATPGGETPAPTPTFATPGPTVGVGPAVALNPCDLTAKLRELVDANGRLQDLIVQSSPDGTDAGGTPKWKSPQLVSGGSATVAGQAYAVHALKKAAAAAPSDTGLAAVSGRVLAFLVGEQATGGAFCAAPVPWPGYHCDQLGGLGDPLTTATVILQLKDTGASLDTAKAALATSQRVDGSFGDAVVTGVAGAALAGTAYNLNSQRAAVWLRQNQADELAACPDGISGETGAVALTVQARNVGRASGIAGARYDWQRATSASLQALRNVPPRPAGAVQFVVPSGYRKAGAVLTFEALNEAPGDVVCITGSSGSLTRGSADLNGHAGLDVALPNLTVDEVYTLHDHTGDAQATVHVLGPATYSLSVVKRHKRGKNIKIKVYGLQPNEAYTIMFRTIKVQAGRAPASGSLVVTYKIRKKARLGKAKVSVVGQTKDRNATKFVRVIR